MKVGALASGSLGREVLAQVWDVIKPGFVATDRGSTTISALAEAKGADVFVGNPRGGKLAAFLATRSVDVLFSINYLFLIERDVLSLVPRVVNLHGSLLPKYRGRTPHVWAIINNESHTGVTAHLVDEGCDTGPIILQREVPIEYTDTGATILLKFSSLYPEIIADVYRMLVEDRLSVMPQDMRMATYFGKRAPEDGLINWNWHRERIYNWVRAQAAPYPGAFTFAAGKKVVIDWVEFDEGGYSWEEPNGTIKSLDPVTVKTPNGLLRLSQVREGSEYLRVNKILGK